ncbi:DUF5658 family protein [Clostridium bowmanii]|uniref:DUF5658 family protein n=1 Tax=Clostridium bowmanii TaxID=132925 RepID=UPI001C0A97E9|nr:DUF5658 family protein [Clostridium bowmanii]MBU3188762.1 hypothetical protein [Clostridium bowmanii]MCA1073347.1 DUF5658 family protein [Clostridium bowmanii]
MSFIIAVLKTRDLGSIKRKLITMYILNVTDIIFTILLVNTGMFLEVNAVMAPFVNNRQLLSIILKVVIPFVLLLGVYKRIKEATEKQLYQSSIIVNGCLIFYGLINVFHIVWSILYIVMKI